MAPSTLTSRERNAQYATHNPAANPNPASQERVCGR